MKMTNQPDKYRTCIHSMNNTGDFIGLVWPSCPRGEPCNGNFVINLRYTCTECRSYRPRKGDK